VWDDSGKIGKIILTENKTKVNTVSTFLCCTMSSKLIDNEMGPGNSLQLCPIIQGNRVISTTN
jgi:hypothetical protein